MGWSKRRAEGVVAPQAPSSMQVHTAQCTAQEVRAAQSAAMDAETRSCWPCSESSGQLAGPHVLHGHALQPRVKQGPKQS